MIEFRPDYGTCMAGVLSVESGRERVPEFVQIFDVVEEVHDLRSTGTVNSCNAPSDTLTEFGLSGSGLRARFFSVGDSPGSFSEQNGANKVLPCHVVARVEFVLLLAEDILLRHFFGKREREIGVDATFSTGCEFRFGLATERRTGVIL